MRKIDLGHGAIAFEPDGGGDDVESFDAERLRTLGISEEAIALFVGQAWPTANTEQAQPATDEMPFHPATAVP